jgi:hypothetical protein
MGDAAGRGTVGVGHAADCDARRQNVVLHCVPARPAVYGYFMLFGRHSRWLNHSMTERGR